MKKYILAVVFIVFMSVLMFFSYKIGHYTAPNNVEQNYCYLTSHNAAMDFMAGKKDFCSLDEYARVITCPYLRTYFPANSGGEVFMYMCSADGNSGYIVFKNVSVAEQSSVMSELMSEGFELGSVSCSLPLKHKTHLFSLRLKDGYQRKRSF
jgi:hypothetical protein